MSLLPLWVQRALVAVGYAILAGAIFWSFGALWYFRVVPLWLARTAALLWMASIPFLFFGTRALGLRPLLAGRAPWLPRWVTHGLPAEAAVSAAWTVVVAIALAWGLKRPSADRVWVPSQARDPVVRYLDGEVEVRNVRNTRYRSADDYEVRWETRRYRLDGVRSLDVMIEPFMEWRGISHFLMSFGFEGGEHLCVSVEARVEAGEGFGIVPAVFNEYELVYILGDERDLIGQRVKVQGHSVYLYPIRVTSREQVRALFVLVLNHASRLSERPRFYNTLTQNCTNTVLRHAEYLTASEFPWWDYRLILPGYIDLFLHDMGAIDTSLPMDRLREACRIDERVVPPGGLSGPEWSAKIREHIPELGPVTPGGG
jgi:hypothetical protein